MFDAKGNQLPHVICFSHLRWNFVFQRPQHLMTRCARDSRRLYFFEEPVFHDSIVPRLEMEVSGYVTVVVPHLPHGLDEAGVIAAQRMLLDMLIRQEGMEEYLLWYYTPMALPFRQHLDPVAIVYDCMD
jgi:UDP-galactopyranose mutase